jgi:hypothetical protein
MREPLAIDAVGGGGLLERGGEPEHAGIEEVHQAPQLAEVVLDGCAREREPVLGVEQSNGARGFGSGVLDGLGFVEDDVIEEGLLEQQGVAAQGAVGGEHDVVALPGCGVAATSWPTCSSTSRRGAKRAASSFQLKTRERGTTTSAGGAPGSRRRQRDTRCASTCTVLPRPMSSARQPPKPKSSRKRSQPRPSRW